MKTTGTRDVRLDTYRAMIMIYTVCVIHITYWFGVGTEPLLSAMLFEMPVIFFIAGASQAVTNKKRGIVETIINRAKRILLPLYIFLFFIFIIVMLATVTDADISPYNIDVHRFTAAGVLKILLTGGSTVLPFYGYTWFVAVYLIISCSLPIQQKLLRHIPRRLRHHCTGVDPAALHWRDGGEIHSGIQFFLHSRLRLLQKVSQPAFHDRHNSNNRNYGDMLL